jgi:hypothetical protein
LCPTSVRPYRENDIQFGIQPPIYLAEEADIYPYSSDETVVKFLDESKVRTL